MIINTIRNSCRRDHDTPHYQYYVAMVDLDGYECLGIIWFNNKKAAIFHCMESQLTFDDCTIEGWRSIDSYWYNNKNKQSKLNYTKMMDDLYQANGFDYDDVILASQYTGDKF